MTMRKTTGMEDWSSEEKFTRVGIWFRRNKKKQHMETWGSVAMRGENIRASWIFSHKKTMVKGIAIIGHEGPRGCGCKGAHTYVYTAMSLGKSRMASPTLGCLYSLVLILCRLSGPQEQSGYENLQPSDTWGRTRAPCRLNHMTP